MNKFNYNCGPSKCPLCGDRETGFLFYASDSRCADDKNILNAVQCKNCKLVFLNPAAETDKWLKDIKDSNLYFSTEKYVENALKRINKYSPGNILDIGCGNGEFLYRARESGWHVAGVELSQKENPHNIPIKYGFFEDMAMPEKHFDIITFWGVTEYLREPVKFFEKIKSALKDGGRILFVAGNYYSIQRAVMKVHNFPRQQFIWSKPAVEYLLKKTGFAITDYDYKNDIRNGGCAEFITFLFKRLILKKSHHKIISEHNSGVKEKNILILAVKAADRIITIPLSFISSLLGFNGVMNITAKKL